MSKDIKAKSTSAYFFKKRVMRVVRKKPPKDVDKRLKELNAICALCFEEQDVDYERCSKCSIGHEIHELDSMDQIDGESGQMGPIFR